MTITGFGHIINLIGDRTTYSVHEECVNIVKLSAPLIAICTVSQIFMVPVLLLNSLISTFSVLWLVFVNYQESSINLTTNFLLLLSTSAPCRPQC